MLLMLARNPWLRSLPLARIVSDRNELPSGCASRHAQSQVKGQQCAATKPSTHTPVGHSKVESHFLRRYIHFITVVPTVLRSDVTCCRCWDIAGKHANLEDMPRLVVVLVVVAGTVIGRV